MKVLIFAAVAPGDTVKEIEALAAKVLKIRLWDDETGRVCLHHVSLGSYILSNSSCSGNRMFKILTARCCVVGPSKRHQYHCSLSSNGKALVSQFTLLASTKKGNKPDFHGAMAGDQAKVLYDHFVKKVQEGYKSERVKDGVFQAMMEVQLVNDGPVS